MANLLAGAERQPLNQCDADLKVVNPNVGTAIESTGVVWSGKGGGRRKSQNGWSAILDFYRLLGIFFFSVAILATSFIVYNVVYQEFRAAITNLLLVLSAILCGVSAYLHEGLSNDVSDMAIENDRFASMSRSLRQEMGDLDEVRERLVELTANMRDDQDALNDTLLQLAHLTNVNAVTSILDAFLEADRDTTSQDDEAKLTGDELMAFMKRIRPMVETVLPSCKYEDLLREVSRDDGGGLSMGALKLLVSACIRGADELPGVSMALLGLFLFSTNIDKYARLCSDGLVALFGDEYPSLGRAAEDIDSILQRISTSGKTFIYLETSFNNVPELKDLYIKVLRKRPKPEE